MAKYTARLPWFSPVTDGVPGRRSPRFTSCYLRALSADGTGSSLTRSGTSMRVPPSTSGLPRPGWMQ
jgi:hypothetical protein